MTMAMAASVPTATTTSHLIHRLLRPPPPSSFFSSLIKPLCASTSASASASVSASGIVSRCRLLHTPISYTSPFASPSPLLRHSRNSLSHTLSSVNYSTSSQQQQQEEEDDIRKIEELIDELEEDDEKEFGIMNDELGEEDEEEEVGIKTTTKSPEDPAAMLRSSREKGMQQISMTVREKKELASYAHSLGKKLKTQLVGKGGVTANVATSFIETLEANELIKIKIHRSCPGELDDVVKQLEELTGSVAVNRIGRTVIVYRPSLTKLKEEEKKRKARRMYVRKESSSRPRPTFVKGGQESRTGSGYGRQESRTASGYGRRGSSRFTSSKG